MFETMQSFLAFFIPTLALIILGIIFEEKLVQIENAVGRVIVRIIRAAYKEGRKAYAKMQRLRRRHYLHQNTNRKAHSV